MSPESKAFWQQALLIKLANPSNSQYQQQQLNQQWMQNQQNNYNQMVQQQNQQEQMNIQRQHLMLQYQLMNKLNSTNTR